MDGKEDSLNQGLLKYGKVACFSEVNDSILMWSYYANKHKGVCIEFDFNKLDLEDSLNNQIKQSVSRVHYSSIRPRGDYFDPTLNNYMFTKSDVWAHEHEWRIVCNTDKEYLPLDCVTGIILGANFRPVSVSEKEILELPKQLGISLEKCLLNKEKYRLEIVNN